MLLKPLFHSTKKCKETLNGQYKHAKPVKKFSRLLIDFFSFFGELQPAFLKMYSTCFESNIKSHAFPCTD